MEIRPSMETISDADAVAVADVDAAPVGEPNTDVDAEDHQVRPLQSIFGLTEIARTGTRMYLPFRRTQ